jgi:hypothetical protein
MGMTVYDALVLSEVARHLPRKARVLSLGVPTLNFDASTLAREISRLTGVSPFSSGLSSFTTAVEFFRALGFEEVDALDISDYEGANIIGDLNDSGLAQKISKRYDLIYDSGTIEHIFDIVGALRTIHSLVEVGGAVVHATPTNGFTDHGFWQVSPDLFRAIYASSGYHVLTSAVFVFGRRPYSLPAERNLYRSEGRRFIIQNLPEAVAVFAAKKQRDVPMEGIKLQDYYATLHQGGETTTKNLFYIPFGDAALGRASRGMVVGFLLAAKDWLFNQLRILRGVIFGKPRATNRRRTAQ